MYNQLSQGWTLIERRTLQATLAIAALVPIGGGLAGILAAPGFLDAAEPVSHGLLSHVAFLSGVLLAIGIGFWTCVPDIVLKTDRLRLLAALIVAGGLARLFTVLGQGAPPAGHLFALAMELIVTPAIVVWQARVARAGAPRADDAPS